MGVRMLKYFEEGDQVIIKSLDRTQAKYGLNNEMHPVGHTVTLKEDVYEEAVSIDEYIYSVHDLELVEDEPEEEIATDGDHWPSWWDGFAVCSSAGSTPLDLSRYEPIKEEVEEPSYIITGDSITLTVNGQSEVVTCADERFTDIRTLVIEGNFEEALAIINAGEGITQWGSGLLEIEDGEVTYAGMVLTGKLVDKIINMMVHGDEEFQKFAKFLNLTMEQSSYQTRERLMDFVAHGAIQLDDQGHVIAFKNVKEDYYDKHSGKFRNMVGDQPSMPRNMVDDNHQNTCSAGLHICSPTYLRDCWGVGGKTMKVVVDPRDFVAIPFDYEDSKARVCKYTVVEDVSKDIKEYL